MHDRDHVRVVMDGWDSINEKSKALGVIFELNQSNCAAQLIEGIEVK
jgi:hypothetical protein